MKIQNIAVESFVEHLRSLNFKHDTYGHRMRVKMIKILESRLKEVFEEISEVNSRYAKKSEDGTFITDDDGKFQFNNNDERLKEISEIMQEEMIIEQNEINKAMLLSIKKSIPEIIPFDLQGLDAERYDYFCELIEQIQYEEA